MLTIIFCGYYWNVFLKTLQLLMIFPNTLALYIYSFLCTYRSINIVGCNKFLDDNRIQILAFCNHELLSFIHLHLLNRLGLFFKFAKKYCGLIDISLYVWWVCKCGYIFTYLVFITVTSCMQKPRYNINVEHVAATFLPVNWDMYNPYVSLQPFANKESFYHDDFFFISFHEWWFFLKLTSLLQFTNAVVF